MIGGRGFCLAISGCFFLVCLIFQFDKVDVFLNTRIIKISANCKTAVRSFLFSSKSCQKCFLINFSSSLLKSRFSLISHEEVFSLLKCFFFRFYPNQKLFLIIKKNIRKNFTTKNLTLLFPPLDPLNNKNERVKKNAKLFHFWLIKNEKNKMKIKLSYTKIDYKDIKRRLEC